MWIKDMNDTMLLNVEWELNTLYPIIFDASQLKLITP